MKELTCNQIAELVKGQVKNATLVKIMGVASLSEASSSHITFLGNNKYENLVSSTKAGIILVPQTFTNFDEKCYIICANPSVAFSVMVEYFAPSPIKNDSGVHPSAVIGKGVKLGENCSIGAHAVIEANSTIGANCTIMAGVVIGQEVVIGDQCLIYPNSTIRERCVIGNRCIIHANSAIGTDGFGFIPGQDGHKKIPQVGIVKIEDDVEIGSCVCIDRARFGTTVIGKGTKIDNLVQIAHNVEIGSHCFIISQSGIAGSTKVGNFVVIAAQAGLAGHLCIGDGTTISGRAGVTKDIEAGAQVYGFPAVSKREFTKQSIAYKKIEKLEAEINHLKKILEP